jgi:hypothetical protein
MVLFKVAVLHHDRLLNTRLNPLKQQAIYNVCTLGGIGKNKAVIIWAYITLKYVPLLQNTRPEPSPYCFF